MFALLQGLQLTAMDQNAKRRYVLPVAHVGERYNVSLEAVLRETYRLRLVQDGSFYPDFKWLLAGVDLPPGLSLAPEGVITGKPTEYRSQPYIFQVRVVDMALGLGIFILARGGFLPAATEGIIGSLLLVQQMI